MFVSCSDFYFFRIVLLRSLSKATIVYVRPTDGPPPLICPFVARYWQRLDFCAVVNRSHLINVSGYCQTASSAGHESPIGICEIASIYHAELELIWKRSAVNLMEHGIKIYRGFIALASVILIMLSGCNTRSTELNAMLENPVLATQLTTGREVSRTQRDKGETLGKPIPAQVILEYEPVNNNTKEDVFNEIATIFDRNNWEREKQSIVQTGYFRATLPRDSYSIVADVLIHSERNTVRLQLGTIPR